MAPGQTCPVIDEHVTELVLRYPERSDYQDHWPSSASSGHDRGRTNPSRSSQVLPLIGPSFFVEVAAPRAVDLNLY